MFLSNERVAFRTGANATDVLQYCSAPADRHELLPSVLISVYTELSKLDLCEEHLHVGKVKLLQSQSRQDHYARQQSFSSQLEETPHSLSSPDLKSAFYLGRLQEEPKALSQQRARPPRLADLLGLWATSPAFTILLSVLLRCPVPNGPSCTKIWHIRIRKLSKRIIRTTMAR